MRDRKEIEKELKEEPMLIDFRGDEILEILLDIRDLLIEIKDKKK